MVASGDRAIVLVEHNLDAAVGLVDRVVVLDDDGCLMANGSVNDVLRVRSEELHELGVWLPTSSIAALRLRRAGYVLDPLSLTPAELRAALEAEPEHVAPLAGRVGREAAVSRPPDVSGTAGLDTPATRPAGAAPPLITVRGLSVRRGRTEVLHDVDLDIRRGDFVAVVGTNGAGKTTLVQAIAGEIVFSGGRVLAHALTADVFADEALLDRAGLRPPPLQQALHGVRRHPPLLDVTRLADLRRRPMTTAPGATDPYAEAAPATAVCFLPRLNPLAKLAGPEPAMVLLVFVRDVATPLSFLLLAYVLLLIGARLTPRTAALVFVGLPAAGVLIACGFAVWTDAPTMPHDVIVLRLGGWTLYGAAIATGLTTALRLVAIAALALVPGLTTTGPDLVRSFVQQLRVPYRIGYTALAAFRFVPRFAHELDVIRQAHRVRGAHLGRGPVAVVARWSGYVLPLLAGAIRHPERVALAMDARTFGAHRDRTERHWVPFRRRDVVFVVVFWAVSALFALWFPWQLG